MSTHSVGMIYEERAAGYLKTLGYSIIERNYFSGHIDIDIIARDRDGYLVFVEVKYRSRRGPQTPLSAVSPSKQRNISMAAVKYMTAHHISFNIPCRFDVVAFSGDEPQLLKNAFPFSLNMKIF